MFARIASSSTVALRVNARAFGSSTAVAKKFSLPDLPYGYDALEPAISKDIMQIHHTKHHNAYVTGLNAAMEKLAKAEADGDVSGVISQVMAIKFNGGGHLNHSIFWKNLAPSSKGGGTMVKGELVDMINAQYGSLDKMIDKLSATCAVIQGSGWGWLGYDKVNNRLAITSCANQDPLLATTGLVPLLGIDMFEHAWYLQYKNDKITYLKNIWSVINWQDVQDRLKAAKKG